MEASRLLLHTASCWPLSLGPGPGCERLGCCPECPGMSFLGWGKGSTGQGRWWTWPGWQCVKVCLCMCVMGCYTYCITTTLGSNSLALESPHCVTPTEGNEAWHCQVVRYGAAVGVQGWRDGGVGGGREAGRMGEQTWWGACWAAVLRLVIILKIFLYDWLI